MSSSSTGSTKRASSSKTKTTTRTSEVSSSTQTSPPLSESSAASIISSIPTNTPSQTTTFANTASVASSSPTAASDSDSGAQKPSSAIVAVAVVLGIVALGLISFGLVFFLRKRRRRQQHPEEPYVAERESKRRDSYPQPTLPDTILHFSSKNDSYVDDGTKSLVNSLDSGLDPMPRRKTRSSRASSSIFVPDDNMTITSRSNYLRPVSLGEPIALKGFQAAYGQMPTLPESPVQPTMERQPSHVASATPKITLDRANSSDSDEKLLSESSHTSTFTRPKTPESVAPSPVLPAQLPPLAPVPPIRYSFLGGTSKRDSNNTLAPSRHDDQRARPQSMLSVYSTRTQNTETVDMSATLSPDVSAVLSRLKKRISTPWSIASAETYRAERMSVTRASVEA